MIVLAFVLGCSQRQLSADEEVTVRVPRGSDCQTTTSHIGRGRSWTRLFDLDIKGGEYYHVVSCSDAQGDMVFATVILTGVPVGTDPAARMAEDLSLRPDITPGSPGAIAAATLSGLPAVQIEGDLAWLLPIHRVTRAVVVEDVLFAAGVWGTREEMTARAEEVPAWLDAVRFHDLDAYRP